MLVCVPACASCSSAPYAACTIPPCHKASLPPDAGMYITVVQVQYRAGPSAQLRMWHLSSICLEYRDCVGTEQISRRDPDHDDPMVEQIRGLRTCLREPALYMSSTSTFVSFIHSDCIRSVPDSVRGHAPERQLSMMHWSEPTGLQIEFH